MKYADYSNPPAFDRDEHIRRRREEVARRDALSPEERAWADYGQRWAQMVSK